MITVTYRASKQTGALTQLPEMRLSCKPDAIIRHLESWEPFSSQKPFIDADEVMANIGLTIEVPKLDWLEKAAQTTLQKLKRLGMKKFLTPEVYQAINEGATARNALFKNAGFYDEVIVAWAKMVDEAMAKAKGIQEKIAVAEAFNCTKANAEIDVETGMLHVPLSKQVLDPSQKGMLYSITTDWIDKKNERKAYAPNPDAPFKVRPNFWLTDWLTKSPMHGHVGRGLACFERMLGEKETRITPERAIELMHSLDLEPGTFQDLFLHLGRPKRHPRTGTERKVCREIFKDLPINQEYDPADSDKEGIPAGKPIVALAPRNKGFVAAFSRTGGLGIALDEACWDGPGFPRGTRFIVVSSSLGEIDF